METKEPKKLGPSAQWVEDNKKLDKQEEKKAETNLEIWKKYQEKEAKGLKKIFIFIFLAAVVFYIVNNGLTETKGLILNFFNVLN